MTPRRKGRAPRERVNARVAALIAGASRRANCSAGVDRSWRTAHVDGVTEGSAASFAPLAARRAADRARRGAARDGRRLQRAEAQERQFVRSCHMPRVHAPAQRVAGPRTHRSLFRLRRRARRRVRAKAKRICVRAPKQAASLRSRSLLRRRETAMNDHSASVARRGPPPGRRAASVAGKQKAPYLIVLALAIFGVAYTSIAQQPLFGYWEFLGLAVGVACVVIGWRNTQDRRERIAIARTQLAALGGLSRRDEHRAVAEREHLSERSGDRPRAAAAAGARHLRRGRSHFRGYRRARPGARRRRAGDRLVQAISRSFSRWASW